jgi:hypothetical protein
MSRKLTAIALLTALVGGAKPALAGPNVAGAARPHVRILPLVHPTIRPCVHIPSISHHVAKQLQTGQSQNNSGPAGDLAVTEQGNSAAMLLPAIQAAREAARKSSSSAGVGRERSIITSTSSRTYM